MLRWPMARRLWLGVLFLALTPHARSEGDRRPVLPRAAGLRVVVLERDDQNADEWSAIGALGANVVATLAPPSAEADRLATEAGLGYLAFLTTREIQDLARDPTRILEARAQRSLAGFYYWDDTVVEGFTTPEAQQRAYGTLKDLFPDKLVLYPTRLDPIVWKPGFLKDFFRPQFTDLVTPYFYPVGTTILGPAQEESSWPGTLAALLSALQPRIPAGNGLLPVLQGFEQAGYPVGARFPALQMGVYRSFWTDLSNSAVFAWRFQTSESDPLVELAQRPLLQQGVCSLFAAVQPRPSRCPRAREVSER